jgi:hypothetical protein
MRIEYLFASHIDLARSFVTSEGWRETSRTSWAKRDGTDVRFVSLLAQLDIVSKGEIVHVVETSPEALRILRRIKAVAICYGKKDAA